MASTLMADPLTFKKFYTSFFTGAYWVKVVALGLGIFLLSFSLFMLFNGIKKAYFTKPEPTTTMGTVGTVVQDCSKQVQDALCNWNKENRKAEPILKLRLWKIMEVRLGNT